MARLKRRQTPHACLRALGSNARSTIHTWRAPSAKVIARAPPTSLPRSTTNFTCSRHGARVVDLGAAPGGWSEVAARRVGAGGRVRRARHSRHEADRRRRVHQARFSRRRVARAPQGDARRRRRRCSVRHGRQCDRPPQDRSFAHHGARRGGGAVRPRGARRRAAASSAKSCKAAPRPCCSPSSSAILPASSTSSRRRAAPIPPSFIFSPAVFGVGETDNRREWPTTACVPSI